ncbi:tRNAHis guanylyltransferase [Dentipellis sp. KUC8613]|nr:tRNAHis guanylyltransferase [Dentipellis sp. KUC8613]
MAGSRFEYVKGFELPDPLLPNTYIVFRLDGHSFHRLSDVHEFVKPNDERALKLMDHAARELMEEYTDITLAFGESDEFSFLLRRSTTLYKRRNSKIVTTLTSYFTSSYVLHWPEYFPDTPLRYPPSFDGRLVLYPSEKEVRDYFAWRQADTHINNMYNTVFWALVQQGGQSTKEAHETLRGTVSAQKNEMLFSRFGINYNLLPERYRKGSVLIREQIVESSPSKDTEASAVPSTTTKSDVQVESLPPPVPSADAPDPGAHTTEVKKEKESKKTRVRTHVVLQHCDLIGDAFWNERESLLA